MYKALIFFLMILSQAVHLSAQLPPHRASFARHKKIPPVIEQNVLTALSFYPELVNTPIRFVLKKNIKRSVMQAQPVVTTLIGNKKKRRYQVNIAGQFKLTNAQLPITGIPDTVMIGWIGHELGHILDYESKSNTGMVVFGCRYLLSPAFVRQAERVADTLAVARGMGRHLIATKRFILDHASIPQRYKNKIARLYLSPDVILELVQQLEARNGQEEER